MPDTRHRRLATAALASLLLPLALLPSHPAYAAVGWQPAAVLSSGGVQSGIPAEGWSRNLTTGFAAWPTLTGVKAVRYATGAWGASVDVMPGPATSGAHDVRLAVSADGSVAWLTWALTVSGVASDEVKVARWSGGSWGAPVTVSATTTDADAPDIATSADGAKATVIYRQVLVGDPTYRARTFSGGAWGAVEPLAAGRTPSSDGRVAMSDDGSVIVAAWARGVAGSRVLQTSRRGATGIWPSATTLSPAGDSGAPRLVLTPSGAKGVLVWAYDTPADPGRAYASMLSSGAWTSGADVTEGTSAIFYDAAISPSGSVLVGWSTGGVVRVRSGDTSALGASELVASGVTYRVNVGLSGDASVAAVAWTQTDVFDTSKSRRKVGGSWDPEESVGGGSRPEGLWLSSGGAEMVLAAWRSSPDFATSSSRWLGAATPPRSVSAVAHDGSATVSWQPPLDPGGAPVTSYTVTASPGVATCTTAALSCTVSGLTNGTAYTLAVRAATSVGSGQQATAGPVTPLAAPAAPTGVVAVPGKGAVTVAFIAPASTPGAPVTSFTATANPGGTSCTSISPGCTITGLAGGVPVVVSVRATGPGGTSPAGTSAPVTPWGPPGAPTGVTATSGRAALVVGWTPPAATGGTAITSFTATASPGGKSCTSASSPCTITGLLNGVAVSVTVRATGAGGTGPASAAVKGTPYAGTITAALKAVNKAGDLRVDVGPDHTTKNYAFTVYKKVGKAWKKGKTYSTLGPKDVVVLKLPKGTYRVAVAAVRGYKGVTSKAVRLLR